MLPLPRLLLALAVLLPAALHGQSRPARLPEVTITESGPRENRPADATGRPEWTSARRFSTTRVYIQKAPWEIGVEQWWRVRDKRDGTVQHKFQEEIELGLPYRMQLDIYVDWFADGDSRARYADTAFELRWAPADWGKIPLNPALYAEYKIVDPKTFQIVLKEKFGQLIQAIGKPSVVVPFMMPKRIAETDPFKQIDE